MSRCNFSGEKTAPMILQCGHSVCSGCIAGLKGANQSGVLSCPTCRTVSNNWERPPKNFKLEEAVTIIKKLKRMPPGPANPVRCSCCDKVDEETDMYVCRNCTKEFHNYDIRDPIDPQAQLDIESMAVCGSCTLRNHVALGHETTPYFDILSGFQFTSQLTSVNLLRDELEQQVMNVEEWTGHFRESAVLFYNQLDRMTDMMRMSESSSIQQSFAKSIEAEIKAFSLHAVAIVESIKTGEEVFTKRLDALVLKNNVDETKCRDKTEAEPREKCSVCSNEQVKEKMYCCPHCSEVVSKLMSGTMEAKELTEFNMSSLPICLTCVVDSHFGGDHKAVKYAEIEKIRELITRRSRVEKREKKLQEKFSDLIEHHTLQTVFWKNYEENISKMSKIMSECKEESIVLEFEETIEKAERAIQFMEMNIEQQRSINPGGAGADEGQPISSDA